MKKCKQGYYYCHTDKKCKRIPTGYRVGLGGYLRKENGEEQGENDNADNTNGNGNGNGNSNGGSNGGGVSEGTLHKWFKGSKSKDGKGGWVNVVTGGTCASDEPGEGTPKCVSSAKRASMSKSERLSAARRKKKADPGQQQKSGAAKPTYVSTDKKKMKKEEVERFEEKFNTQYGDKTKLGQSSERKSLGRGSSIKDGSKPSGYESKKEFRDQSMKLRKHRERFGDLAKEEVQVTEGKDKKGKGSGTKDACYHKVKSRYSVWPSAYASGALVKCRKVGAANWGNKSEEMDYASFAAKAKETVKKNKEKTLKGETKTKKEEWIVDNAAQYFFNEGINEDGVNIFIEELGLEEFVSFVEDLFTDTHLTEARAARRARKGSKSYDQVKAEIDAKEAAKKKSSEKTKAAADTAKKQQPKKRPVLDGIARQVLKGMDRHKKAMARAKQDIETTKKIASKIGKGAKEFGKGVKSGVETAGKVAKVAKKAVSESVQYSDWRDDFKAMEYEFIDLIKPEPLVSDNVSEGNKSESQKIQEGGNFMRGKDSQIARSTGAGALTPDAAKQLGPKAEELRKKKASKTDLPGFTKKKVTEGKYSDSETYVKGTAPVRATYGGKTDSFEKIPYKKKSKKVKEEVETIDEAGKKCWKGYKKAGTQKLFGKTYNRCVKANEEIEVQEATSRPKATQRGKLSKADAQKRQARLDRIAAAKERSGEVKPKTGENPTPKKEKKEKIDPRLERAGNQVLRSIRNEAKDETEEGITGGPIPKKKRSPKKQYKFEKERAKERKKRGEFEKLGDNFSRHRMTGSRGHGTDGDNPRISYIRNQYEIESDWRSEIEEGAAWTKKSGKNPSGGLNEKGRKSYERENPGSDLKRPSKKKGNKRRKSFCARMKGMKKKLTSSKTANDPDSRINKSLRAWNC